MTLTRDPLTLRPVDLNAWANHVHLLNRKWWVNLHTGEPLQRNKRQMYQLMLSEVAEAMEGERKNLQDDKLPHRRMAEVEIADVAIRLLDYAGGFRLPIMDAVAVYGYDFTDENGDVLFKAETDRGEMLFYISTAICYLHLFDFVDDPDQTPTPMDKAEWHAAVSAILHACECYCHVCGYDLWDAVQEKLTYNSTRVDHSDAHRLASGGKAW